MTHVILNKDLTSGTDLVKVTHSPTECHNLETLEGGTLQVFLPGHMTDLQKAVAVIEMQVELEDLLDNIKLRGESETTQPTHKSKENHERQRLYPR